VALVLGPGAGLAHDSSGRIFGTIIDETNAMTLPTAPVEIVGTDVVGRTDLDGRYSIPLAPGTYDVRITFPGYRERLITAVSVVPGEGTELTASLVPDSIGFEEEVTVTAELEPISATDAAQLVRRRKAGAVIDSMGAEEMSQNADGNAADAMRRVTGLSVVDGSYVFVRGLGERYSNTTLNGAVLPTTEPDKRVVPLDLFQSGLIDSIQVLKTYTPDKPADFAGGLVQIEPLAFPQQQMLQFSVKLGYNSQATFDQGLSYSGGGTDFLTFDDGTRALPGIIPADDKLVRGSAFSERGYSPEELQAFGRAFDNTWSPRSRDAGPDGSFGFSYGNSWDRFGAVVSLGYSQSTENRTEDQTYYKVSGGEITIQNDYDFALTRRKNSLGAIANLAYRFSGTDQVTLSNFWTRNSTDETRTFEGYNDDIATDIRNQRLFWVEEGVLSSKLAGEHFVQGIDSRFDWSATFSQARRDEPDLREVLYERNDSLGEFVLADESQSGLRMFNDLEDHIWQLTADYQLFFSQWGALPAVLKLGPSFVLRDRDFQSRRFRMTPRDVRGLDLTLTPEELFASDNVGPHYELIEETRNTDTYEASQDITAGYLMLDLPLSKSWRLVGGARVEQSRQQVTTFDLFDVDRQRTVESVLDDTDVLPGLNLIWGLRPDMNLRFAYSHTVNRPEFRELAEFEFSDVVGGRAVIGNPGLQRALIRNADVRWEWFAGPREVIALSLFLKDFDSPIERVVQPTAQLRTSFANALGAINRGVEVELRKALSDRIFASVNYSFVDSEIELEEVAGQVQTSFVRPLAGQSRHLVNAFLELRLPESGFSGRVLYNFFGDRITDVGSLGLPDIIEQGRHSLDLVLQKDFGPLGLKLSADNLLDADYEFTQGGLTQRLYTRGRTFAISFDYSAF
jgi:hypothetical protein